MINRLFLLVVLVILAPLPVFAIPAGDILGPLMAWFAVMVGFISAGFAVVGSWLRQRGKASFILLLIAFILAVGCAGTYVWVQYRAVRNDIQTSLDKDAKRAQEILNNIEPASTASVEAPLGPLSSRVPSSTLLVPTAILSQVVAEPDWSDRIMVLDIREPEEREIGFIPATSTVIRYGDLIHDLGRVLPHEKDILVICWTSIRGEEITSFLRANGFNRAFAIKGGLQGETALGDSAGDPGWISAGLPWQGDEHWSDKFTNFVYASLTQTKKRFDAGATIVDTRDPEDEQKLHLPGTFSMPIKYMTSSEVSSTIAMLDPDKKTLIVTCEGYVDCFYARILGVRLSRIGWTFDAPFRDLAAWKKAGYPIEP